MKIKRIEQRKRSKGDCGVACVAMVLDQKYELIETIFHQHQLVDENGDYYTFHKDLIGVIEEFGVTASRKMFKSWSKVETPAIVKINVRKGNFWHWVVLDEIDGEKVMYDPKPGLPDQIRSFKGKRGSGQYLKINL